MLSRTPITDANIAAHEAALAAHCGSTAHAIDEVYSRRHVTAVARANRFAVRRIA